MRFSKVFTAAVAVLAPVTTVAASSRQADNIASPLLTRDDLSLHARQNDLTSALGDLVDLLKSISGLLNPEFFDDVQTTVTGLGDLLADPFANQTRSIISQAGGLLDDLNPVLGIIGELDIEGLLDSVQDLLKPETIKLIGGLLTKADTLLTDDFIKDTKGLISDVAPVSFAILLASSA